MPAPKPTLGYASRTDAVIGLRAKGLGTAEIASRIGISAPQVAALAASGGRRKQQTGRTVVVPLDVLARLEPHANHRRISVNEIVRRLLDHVIDDDLVDAVLDDAVAGRSEGVTE